MKAQAFINIIISISYLKVIYSYNYIVGNKANIKIEIPEPPYSYIFYYFQLNIYICKYINNDSYVELGNSIEKISESNFYTYPKSFNNKMININGSDLKFIDYGVTVNLCDQEAYNTFELFNYGSKYKIKLNNECHPTFYLYILKDDTSSFVNFCELYNSSSSKIIFSKEYMFDQGKERTLEFELNNNLNKGIYKVVLLAEKNSMLYSYIPQFITIKRKILKNIR